MTQVIHGMTREQLRKRVFEKEGEDVAMTKLTAEKCREQFEKWFRSSWHPDKTGPYVKDQLFYAWKASRESLELAPPVREQQEMITDNVDHSTNQNGEQQYE